MKRRFMMVAVMMLMLGSQVQMYAQKKGGQDFRKSDVEMRMKMDRRSDRFMDAKAVRQADIEKVQRYFRMKYGIKLSRSDAEKILWVEMRDKGGKFYGSRNPHRMTPRRNR